MKLLTYCSYAVFPEVKGFNKNHSGYGYMVADITQGLSELGNTEVEILTHSNLTKGEYSNGINFIKKNYWTLLKNFNLKTIKTCYHNYREGGKKTPFISQFIYSLTTNYAKSIINNYEAVHIHGLSYYTFELVEYCLEKNIEAVVTLHGINYLNKSIGISEAQAKREYNLIKNILESENIKLTVISSGIRGRIENSLNDKNKKIFVIPNFINSINFSKIHYDIYLEYDIPKNSKIILSVGNVSENKNQFEMVDIFKNLTSKFDNLYLIFVGYDPNDKLKNYCSSLKLEKKIKVCGSIKRELMSKFYNSCQVLTVTSLSEGFGLPIIEAAYFGMPTVAYADIDSVKDIYNGNNMILVNSRSKKKFELAVIEALEKKWDKTLIKNSVNKFMKEDVIKNYHNLLK